VHTETGGKKVTKKETATEKTTDVSRFLDSAVSGTFFGSSVVGVVIFAYFVCQGEAFFLKNAFGYLARHFDGDRLDRRIGDFHQTRDLVLLEIERVFGDRGVALCTTQRKNPEKPMRVFF